MQAPDLRRGVEHSSSIQRWRDSVGEVHTRLSFETDGRLPFRGTRAATALGHLRACKFAGSALTALRTTSDVSQSRGGDTLLLWQLSGASRAAQDGNEVDLPTGTLTFLDVDRPYTVECSGGFAQIVLQVPTDDLRDCMRRDGVARDFRARALHPQGHALPWLAFLRTTVLQSEASPGSMDSMYDASVAVLSELAALAAAGEAPSSPEEALVRSATTSLRRHFGREDLTAAHVAQEHGVSRRTLFRAFDDSGATFSETLQAIRLDAAARMLRRPSSSLTVEAVCRAVGYAAPSSFHVRFTERFGESPGTYRRLRTEPTSLARERRNRDT